MRNLNKNKTELIALNYVGKVEVVDSQGYKTGEYSIVYGDELYFKAHISGAKGNSNVEIFGTDIAYDKTIIVDRNLFDKLGLNENSVFFVDKKPVYQGETPLYDYKVARISKTLNEVAIAISQVRNEN